MESQLISFQWMDLESRLEIEDDGLKAFLSISRIPIDQEMAPNTIDAGSLQADLQNSLQWEKFEKDLCQWIEEQLKYNFVNIDVLKDALSSFRIKGELERRRIAKGIAPTPGKDGKLVFLIKPFSSKDIETRLGYDLNTRVRKRFDVVEPNDIVARIYKEKPGTPGSSVQGHPIVAVDGKAVEFNLSEGLLQSAEGSGAYIEIKASSPGYIAHSPPHISLEQTLVVPGDVSHESGSIHFVNKVHVQGDVLDGFVVRTQGDILIDQNIHNSECYSTTGSISIKGSVFSGDISKDVSTLPNFDNLPCIRAHGLISAQSVFGHAIISETSIEIETSVIRSFLSAAETIQCKGDVYASMIQAACGLEIENIGNSSGVETLVTFIHPHEGSAAALKLKKEAQNLEEQISKLKLFLGTSKIPLPVITNKKSKNPAHKIPATISLLESRKNEIKTAISELKGDSPELVFSFLNITKTAFPGTKVMAGDSSFIFTETKEGPFSLQFDWGTKEFAFKEMAPLHCAIRNHNNV